MELGKPQEQIIIEPIKNPVPQKEIKPDPKPEREKEKTAA